MATALPVLDFNFLSTSTNTPNTIAAASSSTNPIGSSKPAQTGCDGMATGMGAARLSGSVAAGSLAVAGGLASPKSNRFSGTLLNIICPPQMRSTDGMCSMGLGFGVRMMSAALVAAAGGARSADGSIPLHVSPWDV